MPTVRDSMKLHQETVAEAEKHFKRRASSKPRSSRVAKTQMDNRIWSTAKELAEGDVRRVVRKGPDTVYVINDPSKKPAWLTKK